MLAEVEDDTVIGSDCLVDSVTIEESVIVDRDGSFILPDVSSVYIGV